MTNTCNDIHFEEKMWSVLLCTCIFQNWKHIKERKELITQEVKIIIKDSLKELNFYIVM